MFDPRPARRPHARAPASPGQVFAHLFGRDVCPVLQWTCSFTGVEDIEFDRLTLTDCALVLSTSSCQSERRASDMPDAGP